MRGVSAQVLLIGGGGGTSTCCCFNSLLYDHLYGTQSGTLDEKEWVLLCEHIKQDAAHQDAYKVHGSARLPGSKYTIGEIEINECETRGQLQKLVETAKDSGHSGGGCCCFCKTESVLDTWKYDLREDAGQDWDKLPEFLKLGPEPAGA